MNPGAIEGRLSLDTRALDQLRLNARDNPKQALETVAQQFEVLFMQQLMKAMRDSIPQDGMMDSEQSRTFTTMLDQQLIQSTSAKGMGLAKMLVQQLQHSQMMTAIGTDEPSAAIAQEHAPLALSAAAKTSANTTAVEVSAPHNLQQQATDFIARLKRAAQTVSAESGIPAAFILGQAALETGWGKHEIRAADGSASHNLFGIKAGADWRGKTVDAVTTEYINGVPQKMTQKFRAYDSYADSLRDYVNLMQDNPRYQNVLKQRDAAGFAQALQRAGYATDPNYATKLINVLASGQLQQNMQAS